MKLALVRKDIADTLSYRGQLHLLHCFYYVSTAISQGISRRTATVKSETRRKAPSLVTKSIHVTMTVASCPGISCGVLISILPPGNTTVLTRNSVAMGNTFLSLLDVCPIILIPFISYIHSNATYKPAMTG